MCKSDLKPGTLRRRPSSPGSQGRGPHHCPWSRELWAGLSRLAPRGTLLPRTWLPFPALQLTAVRQQVTVNLCRPLAQAPAMRSLINPCLVLVRPS